MSFPSFFLLFWDGIIKANDGGCLLPLGGARKFIPPSPNERGAGQRTHDLSRSGSFHGFFSSFLRRNVDGADTSVVWKSPRRPESHRNFF